jgi:TatD DNase family protein
MIDSHAHVHDPQFDADRDAVLQRAHDAGVERIVTVGCDLKDSTRAIDVARRFGLFASVGIHPHEAKDAPADVAAAFAPLLEAREVVAIGETGLDFFYDHSPRDAQERVLRAQIAVARERALPTIFHVRDAHDRMIEILREEFAPGMRGVIHCFTGTEHEARTYTTEFGLLLGIGGVLTFKTAGVLREAVRAVGVDALVLETDCPYLAPVPMRGKRNEPAFLTHTLEQLAQTLGLSPSVVAERTTKNAATLLQTAETSR